MKVRTINMLRQSRSKKKPGIMPTWAFIYDDSGNLKKVKATKKLLIKHGLPLEVIDTSNDPAVLRMTKKAEEFLKKHPIPREIIDFHKARWEEKEKENETKKK